MCSLKISVKNKKLGWGNRGWLEIIFHILDACQEQSLKSKIMNYCNLNSTQVEKYLDFLIKTEFLTRAKKTEESKKFVYEITSKGEKYMKIYEKLLNLFN